LNFEPGIKILLGNIKLNNPLVLASGVMGTSPKLLQRVALAGAGAVTAKSCGLRQREGHPNPVMLEWEHGLLNAIGLTNPGVEEEAVVLQLAKTHLAPLGVPLFASIFAGTVEEFGQVAAMIAQVKPDMIEVNISCPNVHDDFGLPFAADHKNAAAVTRVVRAAAGDIPIAIKLAPNVPDIGRIAKAVVDAGADVITAINTMPGMVIDADAVQPVLHNQSGGISGPALKPIALRCVAEVARSVDVPIIGTGGVLTGRDAVEMLMAGATGVGVGSALWYRGPEAFRLIKDEILTFMIEKGVRSIHDLIGKAL
jgi:dihydroorotate dehydrogenase (NAD+) catalytic subunit